ncbi:hypothetical protein JCM11251_006506 [Rhodosporidiobolus azoricus]
MHPTSRKPRFTFEDDDEDSERDEGSPRDVPTIVVEEEDQQRERKEAKLEEERHVGFGGEEIVPTPVIRVPATPALEETLQGGRSHTTASNDNDKGTYPPSPSAPAPGEPVAQSTEKEKAGCKKKGFEGDHFKEDDTQTKKSIKARLPPLPEWLAWIPPNLNWKGARPVIRASVAAWCGLLLMLCGPSQRALGQASFLVLVVATIGPASLPIASMLEQTFFQFLLVSGSWAWSVIVLAIAHAARSRYAWSQAEFAVQAATRYANSGMTAAEIQSASQLDIFHGDYLEAASSVVCIVMLGVGTGFLLWLRGFLGPGPATFGVIFAIILQVITLTTGVLFPYPYYTIGLIFFIPFACQLAINLACTFLILPETLAHQFSDRLIAALQPLQKVIADQNKMLKANPRTEKWLEFKSLRTGTNAAIAGVALLGLSESNLTREISFARVNGKDLAKILQHMRILTTRTTGFPHFYEVVEKHLHREESDAKGGPVADDLIIHLGRSRNVSPADSPASSRPASPTRGRQDSSDSSAPDAEAIDKALERVQHLGENGGQHSPSGSVTFSPSPLSPSTRPPSVSHRDSQSHLRRNGASSGSLADLAEHPTRDPQGRSSFSHPSHPPEPLHHFHSYSHPSPHSHDHHAQSHATSRHDRRRSRSRQRHNKHSSSHISMPSLLHDVLHPNLDIKPIGLIESSAYADLESLLHNPNDEAHLEQIIRLLSTASSELIAVLERSVGHLIDTIHRFKSFESTWDSVARYDDKAVETLVKKSQAQLDELKAAHEAYRDQKRLDVIRPFSKLFDPYGANTNAEDEQLDAPSHRGLFWAFAYEHSLIGWSEALIELFETVVKLESKRRRPRLWFPDWRKARFGHTGADNESQDEDPEAIRDLNTHAFSAPRHPDYRPPKTLLQVLGVKLYHLSEILSRRDVLFGVKSAVLIGLCAMPSAFPSTAFFFYRERGIWVIIMICLTSNQYVGDVLFGYLVRVFGTIAGAIVGLLIWSIAAQTGKGNPFALAATCAVAFPLIFFYRVHFKGHPMTQILPSITAQLVIGYSWQDAHYPALSTVGYGWAVCWRRFVCVMIGISIAFVWAFVPPATRQKVTIRRAYAKVIARSGDLICQILSFANTKDKPVKAPKVIVNNLTALRQRVNRTVQARAMAKYELSMQGEWPADIYASLQALQMEILDMLGQFAGVISRLDAKWTKALLHRTQLSNPRFLQELLSTIQLVSLALDHGQALPFIYNPLLERFIRPAEVVAAGHSYGYDITVGDDFELEGLPQHVDLKTICSLEYLRFSAGVSQAYAIINRLDRLMFVAKSLVGESYLIYGLETHGGNGSHRYHRLADNDLHDPWGSGLESRRTSLDRNDSIV